MALLASVNNYSSAYTRVYDSVCLVQAWGIPSRTGSDRKVTAPPPAKPECGDRSQEFSRDPVG